MFTPCLHWIGLKPSFFFSLFLCFSHFFCLQWIQLVWRQKQINTTYVCLSKLQMKYKLHCPVAALNIFWGKFLTCSLAFNLSGSFSFPTKWQMRGSFEAWWAAFFSFSRKKPAKTNSNHLSYYYHQMTYKGTDLHQYHLYKISIL